MSDQAEKLRELVAKQPKPEAQLAVEQPQATRRARVIAVTSGKGGVGKTSLAVNLAISLKTRHERVILIDTDLGLANVDVLMGLAPRHTLADVVAGRRKIEDILIPAPGGLEVVPGASGIAELANISPEKRFHLLELLGGLEAQADILVIDTAAGVSDNVIAFAAAADDILVVVTPEPPSITDAYATVKLISQQAAYGNLGLVANMVSGISEASKIVGRIAAVADHFLKIKLDLIGFVLTDPSLPAATRLRRPLLVQFPNSRASECIRNISAKMAQTDSSLRQAGFFHRLGKALTGKGNLGSFEGVK